jgi:hypothetical protein
MINFALSVIMHHVQEYFFTLPSIWPPSHRFTRVTRIFSRGQPEPMYETVPNQILAPRFCDNPGSEMDMSYTKPGSLGD